MTTAGSLFSGIGGFDLGFEQAGIKTIFQCEIDRHAQGVLRKRFSGQMVFSDVKKIDGRALPAVDVLTFGSPCQDLSRGGKMAGLDGDRSGLFHQAVRIIGEQMEVGNGPKYAVWENVPGAFTSNDGRDFGAAIGALVGVGARSIEWRVLDSQGFGIPHKRKRIFLVADFTERAGQRKILFESEGCIGNFAKTGSQGRKSSDATDPGAQGRGQWWDGGNVTDCLDVSMLTKGQMLPEKRRFPCVYDQGDRLRRLTPLEVERCHGFPDNWTLTTKDESGKESKQSDIQRFKQLGNAVSVPVAKWIAGRIIKLREK